VFKGRHFDRSVILLCVRWYLAYSLSLRDLEEMIAERGISVDHGTVYSGLSATRLNCWSDSTVASGRSA
jgi:transposase-like protein